MADVWVSRKKWTCQYCNVTINDDAPSRQHHESGGRHKGNVERALNTLYKKGERDRKDAQAAKREMDRIERLAAASYARDLSAAADAESSTATSSESSKPPPIWKPKNKLTAYGSVMPSSQTQVQSPTEQVGQLHDQSVVGDWEEVRMVSSSSAKLGPTQPASDRQQAKSFHIKEKVGKLHDDEDDEDDAELARIKTKKRNKRTANALGKEEEEQQSGSLQRPVWSPLTLVDKQSDQGSDTAEAPLTTETQDTLVATETKPDLIANSDPDANPPTSSLFKKRKTGSGAGAKKVRAIV